MNEGVDIRGYRLDVYRDSDGSWVAEVPELPGCVAATSDPKALFMLVEDAIDAWVEAAEADGRDVPLPAPPDEEYSGRFVLRIAKHLHAQLARQARREGVSLNAYCAT